MAKKKSMGKLVTATIMKSFFVVLLMLVVGMLSYSASLKYYEVTEDTRHSKDVLDIVGDVTADAVSRNLIYSVDTNSSRIKGMVVEVLNTETGNLDFITIPENFQFLLNNDMFQRLYAAGVDVPQVMKMSHLNQYFDNEISYEYGQYLIENYFGVDIGYYTMIPEESFNAIFRMDKGSGCYQLTDEILAKRQSVTDVSAMSSFIKSEYEAFKTNIKMKSKTKYSEAYFNVKPELVYYYSLPGQEENGGFTIDASEGLLVFEQVYNNTSHTVPQALVRNIPSTDLRIKVLNGSGGNGVAGKVKEILEKDGFKVKKIADNPEIIQETVIKVREEGMGNDLVKYFGKAGVLVTDIEKGFDIIIIVGAADAQITVN